MNASIADLDELDHLLIAIILVVVVLVEGAAIPAASLIILLGPVLLLRNTATTLDDVRLTWVPIVLWVVAWLVPVSSLRASMICIRTLTVTSIN